MIKAFHMKTRILTILLFFFNFSFGQSTQKIEEEGFLLYRLEKAAWNATDIFMESYSLLENHAGGYISYLNKEEEVITAFYDLNDHSKILIRFTFDEIPESEPKSVDPTENKATPLEKDLIEIRENAIRNMKENKDEFFTFYHNTGQNFIPLISGKKKKVFILTSTQVPNSLLLGNDYVLEYNRKNKLKRKTKLHEALIFFQMVSEDEENPIEWTSHTHILDDLITSTDICTLLLNSHLLEWNQHYVIGKKYVSLFNIEKNALLVLKRKVWEKILKENQSNAD